MWGEADQEVARPSGPIGNRLGSPLQVLEGALIHAQAHRCVNRNNYDTLFGTVRLRQGSAIRQGRLPPVVPRLAKISPVHVW